MSKKDWESIEFTNPEEHNPNKYVYLVHAIQTDPMCRTIQNIVAIKNGGHTYKIIDLSLHPKDIFKKPIISCSLIGKGEKQGKSYEKLCTFANVRINFKSTTRKYFIFIN